jgi:hypothetical protein
MAVTPPKDGDPAVGGRAPGAVSVGLGQAAGDQRGTGAGAGRGAPAGPGVLYVGAGAGVGLGVGGSTTGAASVTYVEGDGDGGLGEDAAACSREALHPPAASRMPTQAVAIRFLNESLL